MGFIANVQDKFEKTKRYLTISSYQVDRDGKVVINLDIYTNQATYQTYKDAKDQIETIKNEITTKQKARDVAYRTFIMLSKADQNAGSAAFEQNQEAAATEIKTLYDQQMAQEAAVKNNSAGMTLSVPTNPGDIPVGANGEVSLAALYSHLMTADYPDATQA